MSDEKYSANETAARRDAVVRRMANTRPQPKIKSPTHHQRQTKADADRVARKGRDDRGD